MAHGPDNVMSNKYDQAKSSVDSLPSTSHYDVLYVETVTTLI